MERAQEPSANPSPERPGAPSQSYISPIKAFAGLMLLVAAIVGVAILTRPEEPQVSTPPSSSGEEQVRLTEAQAIKTFKELDALRVQAYKQRDRTLLPLYVASGSPLMRTGRKEIAELLNDDVIVYPHFRTRRLTALEIASTRILIRQVVAQRPIFRDPSGKDITVASSRRLLTIDWILRPDNSEWKFFNSRVIRSLPLHEGQSP